MDARTAAREALGYVCLLESLPRGYEELGGFLDGGHAAIEGARLSDEGVWQISVGFDRPWDRDVPSGMAMLLVRDGGSRTLKTVFIDNTTHEVIDYQPL